MSLALHNAGANARCSALIPFRRFGTAFASTCPKGAEPPSSILITKPKISQKVRNGRLAREGCPARGELQRGRRQGWRRSEVGGVMDLLGRLTGPVLEAIESDEAFANLPRLLADETRSISATLQLRGLDHVVMSAEHGLSPTVVDQYAAYYMHHDIWVQRYPLSENNPLTALRDFESFVSAAEFEQSEIYNDLLKPNTGVFRCAGFLADVGREDKVVFGAQRTKSQPSFEPELLDNLQALPTLLSHMMQARRRRQLSELSLAERLLDEEPDAIFIVARDGAVSYRNAAAAQLVEARSGLVLAKGVLSALDPPSEGAFSQAVRWACTGKGGRLMSIMAGERPLVVEIDSLGGADRALASVRVRNETARLARSISRATAAFGLSRAEARLAEGLLTGVSVTDYAQSRSLALPTVRSQVRALFAKTGVNRQTELFVALRGA